MNKTSHQPIDSGKAQQVRRMRSRTLFNQHNEVVIEHAGQEYRLRITRQNKLILTK